MCIYICVCVYVYVYILLCILVQDVFFNTVLIMSHNGHVDKIILRTHADVYIYIYILVGGLEHFFPFSWEFHHPN